MRVFIQKVGNRMGQGIKSVARHLAASEMESGAYTCPITVRTFSPLTLDIFVRISLWAFCGPPFKFSSHGYEFRDLIKHKIKLEAFIIP